MVGYWWLLLVIVSYWLVVVGWLFLVIGWLLLDSLLLFGYWWLLLVGYCLLLLDIVGYCWLWFGYCWLVIVGYCWFNTLFFVSPGTILFLLLYTLWHYYNTLFITVHIMAVYSFDHCSYGTILPLSLSCYPCASG